MLEISPLTAQATQSGISSVFRDALLELRAEGAAEDPSGKPKQDTVPDTESVQASNSLAEPRPGEPEILPAEVFARPGEFVIGPLQIATIAFVGVLLIGVISAGFYLAGRGNIEKLAAVSAPVPIQTEAPKLQVVKAVPVPIQALAPAPVTLVEKPDAIVKPEFNKAYLQLMSVETGVAEVMASGLRQKGVPAFVGPGVTGQVARVLIGPLATPAVVNETRTRVEKLGFKPFARLFTEQDFRPPPHPVVAPMPPPLNPPQ